VYSCGYLCACVLVTGRREFSHNPVSDPKPASFAEGPSQHIRGILAECAARSGAGIRIVIIGPRQRIAAHHRFQQLLHHLPFELVCRPQQPWRGRSFRLPRRSIPANRSYLHALTPKSSLLVTASRSLIPVLLAGVPLPTFSRSLAPWLSAVTEPPDRRPAHRLLSSPAGSKSRPVPPPRYVAIP